MTKPTVGRIMWYYRGLRPSPAVANLAFIDDDQPCKADVCFVHGENLVNVLITDHMGNQTKGSVIPIIQDGSPYQIGIGETVSGYLMWMPYQIQRQKQDDARFPMFTTNTQLCEDNKGIDPQYEGGLVTKAQEQNDRDKFIQEQRTRVSHLSTGE